MLGFKLNHISKRGHWCHWHHGLLLQTWINLNTSMDKIITSIIKCGIKINNSHGIDYHQISNIRHTSVGNKFVDHSDVVGASPPGAAPTSFLTQHVASMDCANTTATRDKKHLSFGIWCRILEIRRYIKEMGLCTGARFNYLDHLCVKNLYKKCKYILIFFQSNSACNVLILPIIQCSVQRHSDAVKILEMWSYWWTNWSWCQIYEL